MPLDYDPMLSKLVAYGETREMAIDRMLRALDEYFVGGIKTNIALFQRILRDEDFRAAKIDTGYLERLLAGAETEIKAGAPEDVVALAAAWFVAGAKDRKASGVEAAIPAGEWGRAGRREGLRG